MNYLFNIYVFDIFPFRYFSLSTFFLSTFFFSTFFPSFFSTFFLFDIFPFRHFYCHPKFHDDTGKRSMNNSFNFISLIEFCSFLCVISTMKITLTLHRVVLLSKISSKKVRNLFSSFARRYLP